MDKNVKIPQSLLARTVELLLCWDLSGLDERIRNDYRDILCELKLKMQKIELRDFYGKIISADSQDARDDARIEYLRKKSQIGNFHMPL